MTYDHHRQKRGPYYKHGDFSQDRPETPGAALRAFRKSLGLTQAEFVKKVYFGRSALAQYENGTRPIIREALDAIHDAYPSAVVNLPIRYDTKKAIWSTPCRLSKRSAEM